MYLLKHYGFPPGLTGHLAEFPRGTPAHFGGAPGGVGCGTMKIIGTHTHGILDYVVGLILIAAPWLFGFARGGAETWIFVALGVAALIYSLFTRYELSLVKALSMKAHLTLDIMSGILLAASPWLFGFSDFVYLPHVIFGLIEIFTAMMTRTTPDTLPQTTHRHA